MKRSEINLAIIQATACFNSHGWTLPPRPRWDVTDFSLGDFRRYGLVLVNLAEEPEYCEKLMYAEARQTTPAHCHARKKEDIIARWGQLAIRVWAQKPSESADAETWVTVRINGDLHRIASGATIRLTAGERITLVPGVYHEFYPETDACIIGEVSMANDDQHDNFFADPRVGRYSPVEDDEPPLIRLLSDG